MSTKKISNQPLLSASVELGPTSMVAKVMLIKHLAIMLKSGLAITEALKILYQSTTGRLRRVVGEIYNSVKAGQKLANALKRYPKIFSALVVGAVYAGEASGTLGQNLENVAAQLKKEKELADKIKSALLYPIIILTAAFGMSLFLSFYILPKIVPLFEGLKMSLPWTTRVLISFSHLIENYSAALAVGLAGGLILVIWLARQRFSQPLTHWLLINFPFIKLIVCHAALARFSHTLGTLLASGLNISTALEITIATTPNFYYRQALLVVAKGVNKGGKLSVNLAKFDNYFPLMTVRMVAVGEESGRLQETLLYLADFYETEVDNAAKNLSTVIEPILLIAIGLAVGFLALSIITPIYNITGRVNR